MIWAFERGWLAARLPHVQSQYSLRKHPFFSCFRIYGLRPHYRLCLFDWTKTLSGTRIRLFALTLYNSMGKS